MQTYKISDINSHIHAIISAEQVLINDLDMFSKLRPKENQYGKTHFIKDSTLKGLLANVASYLLTSRVLYESMLESPCLTSALNECSSIEKSMRTDPPKVFLSKLQKFVHGDK